MAADPRETGPQGRTLSRRKFIRRALEGAAAAGVAAVVPGLASATEPERKPVPGDTGMVVPGKKKTPTPTPTRKPTEVAPPSPSSTPEATATPTPEALPPIRLSYEDFADRIGGQLVAKAAKDQEMEALGDYLNVRENRQVFPNLSSDLGVYGLHRDMGEYPGQDWFFIEDIGGEAEGDDRYWLWYGGRMWPLGALKGQQWGFYRDEENARLGIAINENGEWTYPNFHELGIAQIIEGTARHPSEDMTPVPESAEVTGDGFRWEQRVDPTPENWDQLVGTVDEGMVNPANPFDFANGYRANVHYGILEATETLPNGHVRCTFNAGSKGRMTVIFHNGEDYTSIYNIQHNGLTHSMRSGEVKTPNFPIESPDHGPVYAHNIGCRPWPVREEAPGLDLEEKTQGHPIRLMNVASERGQVVGFRVPDKDLPKVGDGATIESNVIVTTGGDWDSKSW